MSRSWLLTLCGLDEQGERLLRTAAVVADENALRLLDRRMTPGPASRRRA